MQCYYDNSDVFPGNFSKVLGIANFQNSVGQHQLLPEIISLLFLLNFF